MLRKAIQKEINKLLESFGKQQDIYNSTEKITKIIVAFLNDYLENHKEILFDGSEWEFSIPEIPSQQLRDSSLIEKIKVNVEYIYSSENEIGGQFKKVKFVNNGYVVFLNLKIKTKRNISEHSYDIEYWLAHELHHAFRHIKTINKETRSKILNKARNYTNFEEILSIKNNPELRTFMDMFYLHLPQEVEARQQEVSTQLKNSKTNTPTETIEYLQQVNPINDARKMLNYSIENILLIDDATLNNFILVFNKNIEFLGIKKDLNYDRKSFLLYWQKKINNSGNTLLKKILRMVSDKHQLTEHNLLFSELEDSLLKEVFGIF
jgi:hypothetical protein